MNFPLLAKDFDQAAKAFTAVSRNKVIKGCVGALNGCLFKIVPVKQQMNKHVALVNADPFMFL
jgi:hypothetical protein